MSELNDLECAALNAGRVLISLSDDRIIARQGVETGSEPSSLDEVTQSVGKNIPDASSWLSAKCPMMH